MYVQENIQPLLWSFNANITAPQNTSIISIANVHAVRIVAYVGVMTGANSLRVFVNDVNSTSGAVELTAKTTSLATNNAYEISVTGEEAITAKERAAWMYLRIDVGTGGSVPIALEISAFPARQVPATLPSSWTRKI